MRSGCRSTRCSGSTSPTAASASSTGSASDRSSVMVNALDRVAAVAIELDGVLGDTRPLWEAWLADVSRRAHVDPDAARRGAAELAGAARALRRGSRARLPAAERAGDRGAAAAAGRRRADRRLHRRARGSTARRARAGRRRRSRRSLEPRCLSAGSSTALEALAGTGRRGAAAEPRGTRDLPDRARADGRLRRATPPRAARSRRRSGADATRARCRARRSSRGRSRCPRRRSRGRRRRSGSASARRRIGSTVTSCPTSACRRGCRRSPGRRAGRRRSPGSLPLVPFDHACCRWPPRSCHASVPAPSATKTQVPFQTAGAEKRSVAPGRRLCLQQLQRAASRAGSSLPVLAALHEVAAREQRRARSSRGRGRCAFSSSWLAGVQWPTHARRIGRQHDHAVAEVRPAVVGRVAGGDEQVAGCGIDDGARARPDRRVARAARRRLDDRVPVGAERVPHVSDVTVLRARASRRGPGRAARRRCSRRSSRSRGRARS